MHVHTTWQKIFTTHKGSVNMIALILTTVEDKTIQESTKTSG